MLRYLLIIICLPQLVFAQNLQSPVGDVEITQIANGLREPWSIGFLPDGGVLVTERAGKLQYFDSSNRATSLAGVPNVQTGGQAGLFDVLVPKNFEQSGEIFLSYARGDGAGTAVARAELDLANGALRDVTEIFVMNSPSRSSVHFGGRLVEASDAAIFLTLGERGDRNLAQNPAVDNGSVVLILKNGSGYQTISKGHRNPQGAALGLDEKLYVNEHGAMGGDEINRVEKSKNYGWPVISYGLNYDGSKIGEGYQKSGFEQPIFYWDPSIAPSGLAIHSGAGWPEMQGVFLVGSLKFNHIALLKFEGRIMNEIGLIKGSQTGRVRDVRVADDGSIWFLSVNNGALYRIAPAP